MSQRRVFFGASLGQWNGADVANVAGVLDLATTADAGGLDLVTIADHLYFGDKLDAYSVVAFALGRTTSISGLVTVTNLPTRPAPLVARALSGGGEPVTFDGAFYRVYGLDPAPTPAPPIWTGSVRPKSLAVTGRAADGWVPAMGSDWLSTLYRESRPLIDEAAAEAGRDPSAIVSVFNFGGRITAEPLAQTRGEDGRWIGGSVGQWVEEMASAVIDHDASGFIFRTTDDTPAPVAVARYAEEIVPAVREAVGKG